MEKTIVTSSESSPSRTDTTTGTDPPFSDTVYSVSSNPITAATGNRGHHSSSIRQVKRRLRAEPRRIPKPLFHSKTRTIKTSLDQLQLTVVIFDDDVSSVWSTNVSLRVSARDDHLKRLLVGLGHFVVGDGDVPTNLINSRVESEGEVLSREVWTICGEIDK